MKTSPKLIIGLLLGFTFLFAACGKNGKPCVKVKGDVTTQTRDVDAFTAVDLDLTANVYISQIQNNTAPNIKIEAPESVLDFVKTEVNEGHLEIFSERCFKGDEAIKIYLTVENLEEFVLDGSGNVTGETTITSEHLTLEIDGAGDFDLDLATDNLTTKIDGSGDFDLTGQTETHHVDINGSGDIHAYGLESRNSTIEIDGSGDCQVHVTENLEVKIPGSGNVYYIGNPSITTNISGSGDIISEN